MHEQYVGVHIQLLYVIQGLVLDLRCKINRRHTD